VEKFWFVSIQKSKISGWSYQPSAISTQPNGVFFDVSCWPLIADCANPEMRISG